MSGKFGTGVLLRFNGSSQHRGFRSHGSGWCAWSMLDLLACSSLVRILSARRLGQGSAVADRGVTAERRGAPLTVPSTVRGCAPRGTGQPGLAAAAPDF